MTEHAAAADLAAMLRLCEAGKLRCSDKTRRPTAATVQLVAESLADGDFYLGMHGPVASFAWPLLLQAGGLAELAGTRLQLTSRGPGGTGARDPSPPVAALAQARAA